MNDDIRKMADCIHRYDDEASHGVIHTEEYKKKIEEFRLKYNEWFKVESKRLKNLPKYDIDNHVGGCGCVVSNGIRIIWCGDHY